MLRKSKPSGGPKLARIRPITNGHRSPPELKAAEISQRYRRDAVILAVVALLSLYLFRSVYDVAWVMAAESITMLILIGALNCYRYAISARNVHLIAAGCAFVIPWLADRASVALGFGNGYEILVLSGMAWLALAIVLLGNCRRQINISVVGSGFLTLFIACMSDHLHGVIMLGLWGTLCLWWMVSNQWEHIATTAAVNVRRPGVVQSTAMLAGLVCFGVTALLAFVIKPDVQRLGLQWMPTSGGSSGFLSSARSGVGDGQMVVAAAGNASSFGNVDTNVFADSPEPSLFDLFSEQFGTPKKKKRNEQTQALSATLAKEQESKLAEAKQSEASFSVDRTQSTPQPKLKDLNTEALMFWSGRTNMRLASQRFARFDGTQWTNSHDRDEGHEPHERQIGDQTWFQLSPAHRAAELCWQSPRREAIKFTNYRVPTIPIDCSMGMWSISDVDRADMFAVDPNGCVHMTNREKVPDYTVVHFVNHEQRKSQIESALRTSHTTTARSSTIDDPQLQDQLRKELQSIDLGEQRGWNQVQAVLDHLRSNYQLRQHHESCNHGDSYHSVMQQFFASRQGCDYHFATAATLLLRQIGYDSRFVCGFYVAPRATNLGGKDISILKSDVHAWTEIQIAEGVWIPIEPSPGFPPPDFAVGLWERLQAVSPIIALTLSSILIFAVLAFLLRRRAAEFGLQALYGPISLRGDAQQLAWFLRTLDWRLKMAGLKRPAGKTPHTWLASQIPLDDAVLNSVNQFFSEANRISFGTQASMSPQGRQRLKQLWRSLTTHHLIQARRLLENS